MDSRREFIKKAAMLSGGIGMAGMLPAAIQKALAIDPAMDSTYLDAEHVVILMQENRSFDHCYGSLQGVRGFNDPRAIQLPDNNKVWLQTNDAGQTFAPFRLNIKDTKATHMGDLPHSWPNQVDARNAGHHDKWLQAKKSGNRDYNDLPLTMGYYNRQDLPFYYGLADAFTVCDQAFCSSLTGTTPNRLYLWTGTIRKEQNGNTYANVRNEDVDYQNEVNWTTFPERLEDNGISWKIYQNEISVGVGLEGEAEGWLANFTDNPIEWFEQYHVRFLPAYIQYLPEKIALLETSIKTLEEKLTKSAGDVNEAAKLKRQLQARQKALLTTKEEQVKYTPENYAKLSQRERNLHEKAFTTNVNDPDYHAITSLQYDDEGTPREVHIPKGDILHQFRADVNNGQLPTVSWVVAPANFSDHPGSPWYGAWYVSEVMDILTKNPAVWKKTIFILCYDENDGYFDHVPPFTPPYPGKPETGLVSQGIDTSVEWLTKEQELKKRPGGDVRESPIGLGYRVPLVIASPWSRGGAVNSQVFDHTSILMFLEKFLSHKTGKKIGEPNISTWRRTVCGDLTSVFKPYKGEKIQLPTPVIKNDFIESVHKAKFKNIPSGFHPLTKEELDHINQNKNGLQVQEPGNRPACALPYELYVNTQTGADKKIVTVKFKAGNDVNGQRSSGAPFMVYAPGSQSPPRSYAVAAGDTLTDNWEIASFANNLYKLQVYGPNGFYREFSGNVQDPLLDILCTYSFDENRQFTGNLFFYINNINTSKSCTVIVRDNAYNQETKVITIPASEKQYIKIDLSNSHHWYDCSILVKEAPLFERRYAGKIETGKEGVTDPMMGNAG